MGILLRPHVVSRCSREYSAAAMDFLVARRDDVQREVSGGMTPMVEPPDPARGVYGISVAAELAGMAPQALRLYETKGLLEPARTAGGSGWHRSI